MSQPQSEVPNQSGQQQDKNTNEEESNFDCSICFDTPEEPVITKCGHLFCWQCLYKWLEHQKTCPVCKSGLTTDNVIPIYGKGKKAKTTPSTTSTNSSEDNSQQGSSSSSGPIPSRPSGQRTEQVPQHNYGYNPNFSNYGYGSYGTHTPNFTISAGIGLFSLPLFDFNFQTRNGNTANNNPTDLSTQAFLSRVLLMLGSIVLLSIILI